MSVRNIIPFSLTVSCEMTEMMMMTHSIQRSPHSQYGSLSTHAKKNTKKIQKKSLSMLFPNEPSPR